jgi:hypothetical protein
MLTGSLMSLRVLADDRLPWLTDTLGDLSGPLMPLLGSAVFTAVVLLTDGGLEP